VIGRTRPDVMNAYEALGKGCAEAGPLAAKMRELITLVT